MRTSRVPYHQNVYDLLQIEPGECTQALCMIREYESEYGALPASIREWYLVPNMAPLQSRNHTNLFPIWEHYRGEHLLVSLNEVLFRFSLLETEQDRPFVCFANHNGGAHNWWLNANGTADPPVWIDNGRPLDRRGWSMASDSFSHFLRSWFAVAYVCVTTRPKHDTNRTVDHIGQPRANGNWFCSPDEPLQPPVIDFLTDQFGEPERAPRPGSVTTYSFKPPGGTIRVTADEPSLTCGLSAWWIHADTPERLAEFGALLLPWGTLRDTLRADTDPARAVLSQLKGERPG